MGVPQIFPLPLNSLANKLGGSEKQSARSNEGQRTTKPATSTERKQLPPGMHVNPYPPLQQTPFPPNGKKKKKLGDKKITGEKKLSFFFPLSGLSSTITGWSKLMQVVYLK